MSAKGAARELDLPDVVDLPATDTSAAVASLELAGGEAEAVPGPDPSVEVDPSAPAEKKKPGPKPGAARPRGDATITQSMVKDLRKAEIETLLFDLQRRNVAQSERIEDLTRSNAIGAIAKDGLIDDAIVEAVGASIDTISNLAAKKFGPAARVNPEQRGRLVTPWTRVAKLYLGQHAQYSPLAAALLATAGVVSEKWVDVEIAAADSPLLMTSS